VLPAPGSAFVKITTLAGASAMAARKPAIPLPTTMKSAETDGATIGCYASRSW
jgi:hypothetical protein